ncbi:MAG: D-alanine--D-alanine ligase A [Acidobacteria bacterium]|nr:MAG: D-alanine--D-alanine ligase A [Acidobacteriota bacterium]
MAPRTTKVAVLFGGRSGEHEISVRSAASVVQGLSVEHEVLPVLVDRRGGWWLQPHTTLGAAEQPGTTLGAAEQPGTALGAGEQSGPGVAEEGGTPVFLVPSITDRGVLRRLDDSSAVARPDVYFPVLHGTYGEDGTMQGLLELAGVPFVGSGCAASAAGMDKALMKGLFTAASLPQAKYVVLLSHQREQAQSLVAPLGWPVFVKPANLGSSVGVSKVKRPEGLADALDLAFEYDRKVIVEEGLDAREIEIAVLGNDSPQASIPGEIVPDREFYDYDSKYSAESRTELRIPAPIPAGAAREAQELGVRSFQAVDASGYARVDFLMDRRTGKMYVNEINTIPGFTSISMFPKLWDASGIEYDELLSQLVDLAFERHRQRRSLRTDYR